MYETADPRAGWSYVHNMGEEPTFSMDARIPRVGLSEDWRLMLKKKEEKK